MLFADRVSGHRQPVRVRVAAGDGGEETAGGREVQAEDSVQREDCHLPVTTLAPLLVPSLLSYAPPLPITTTTGRSVFFPNSYLLSMCEL